ncbi:uncharacterized protein LOC121379237 [Gigantopelta aegis]|uniref:uncharacterized protein LOC121379237 n=1 Tax=Gigantopelta aegis TaxID=1735272 RepID=UPI001B88B807|nr:uncharacterized protein LOC121379237 [Gigantopelta aegis]XP_041363688.1 uncharacterized protein LOC121379237 [Gigantopelta aegis]XP_041363689.1 uncharacterized protein LOC121379237 [Gigantopelta aegis]XP_041363690.1 uncharacterized protein LOC121379237 [Gigantopelta aegis]
MYRPHLGAFQGLPKTLITGKSLASGERLIHFDEMKDSQRDAHIAHVRKKGGNEIHTPRYAWKENTQTNLGRPRSKLMNSGDAEPPEGKTFDSTNQETAIIAKETLLKSDVQASGFPTRDSKQELPNVGHQVEQHSREMAGDEDMKNIPASALKSDMLKSLQMMGQFSRKNLFPGLGKNRFETLNTSVYSDEVHQRRFPETEKYRLRKDEFRKRNPPRGNNTDAKGLHGTIPLMSGQVSKLPTIVAKPETEPDANHGPSELGAESASLFGFGNPPAATQSDIQQFPEKYDRDEEFWTFYNSPVRVRSYPSFI